MPPLTDARRAVSLPRTCLCSLPALFVVAVAHAGELTPTHRCPELPATASRQPTLAPGLQSGLDGAGCVRPGAATPALRVGESGRSPVASGGAVGQTRDAPTSKGGPGSPAKGAADVSAIMPGDTISIIVFRRPDLSCQVRVPREGKVMLPGAGAVRATGMGVEELAHEVARLLEARERLLEARVTVSVLSYGVRTVFVEGAVAQPQSVEIPAEAALTLTQAAASCGGFAPDADRARIRITRRTRGEEPRVVVVDASAGARGLSPELDLRLESGDTIHVPRREPVYVLGQVKKQGALVLPLEYSLTVSKAIALSGGFTPYARHSRVRVTRRTPEGVERFSVDVGDILVGGKLDNDIGLMPGDIVYIPERVF